MVDIIERLATARNMMELERAAADAIAEIERLRDHRKMLFDEIDKNEEEIEEQRSEIERLRELLREGLGEHVRLHVHPHFPAWEKRVREAIGE